MTAAIDVEAMSPAMLFSMPFERRLELLRTIPRLRALEERLLAIGGDTVVLLPNVFDCSPIERWERFPSDGVQMVRGQPSQCHTNVAALWLRRIGARKPFEIVTGWGLSKDGMWREHSWGFQGGHVIETTVARTIYYGVRLTKQEAIWRALDILPEDDFRQLATRTKAAHAAVGELVASLEQQIADKRASEVAP